MKRAGVVAAALAALLLVGPAAAQVDTAGPPGRSPGTPPAVITIPAIGLEAPVVPLELEPDGSMAAPRDPDTVGWFDLGPGLGQPGNVLLDGHVDWGGRPRAFGRLQLIAAGDRVQLADADGSLVAYHVVWRAWYDAATTDVDDIFGQTSDQELTMITCGGVFDHAQHQYLSRLVVRAVRDEPDSSTVMSS